MAHSILTREFAKQRKEQIQNPKYELFLKFEKKVEKYSGKCKIVFDLKREEEIVLDYIGNVKKTIVNGKESKYEKTDFNIKLSENLVLGKNEVEIEYEAKYDHTGAGMHQFTDVEDGSEYIYTHFEPYDAHRVFPCFDQPDLKAKLKLSVEIPNEWVAISNEIVESEEKNEDKKTVKFAETKKLSTYLFEIAVGDYEFVEDSHLGIPMKIYFRKSMGKYVRKEEMFKLTKQGLDFFNSYFDYKYPFSKYDQLFVPEFNFGAMEQPGAVTFSEHYLLRRKPTRVERARFANTLIHEMAHMWFGDLVTMKWWDDLWLNESFADFISHYALTKATEFENAWEDFYARKAWAYHQDQLITTHPIVADAEDTDIAFSNFDGISYSKGASVLKQLMFYIGEENFRNGLRNYFKRYEWENTELNDFLECLEEACGKKLGDWFDIWVKTTGVNSIKPEVNFADNKILNFKINQEGSKDNNLLRKHKTNVAFFYDLENPKAEVVKEITYEGKETIVNLDASKDNFAFAFFNYNDWDYVKDYLDEKSMNYVLKNISKVKDQLTKQMIYGSLWQMVRDAELDPKKYLDFVFENMESENSLLSLERSALRARNILNYYLNEENFKKYCDKFFDLAWKMLNSDSDSERKNVWFNIFVFSASGVEREKVDKLISILIEEKQIENFELDQDKRWGIIVKLSSLNHEKTEEFLEKEKQRDKSDRGEKMVAVVESANIKNKKQFWDLFVSAEGKSLDFLRDAMQGFYWRNQKEELREYIDLFFDNVKELFEKHDKYYMKSFFGNLFPLVYAEEEVLTKAKKYLEEFKDANKLLVKDMKEGIDDLERVLKILKRFG